MGHLHRARGGGEDWRDLLKPKGLVDEGKCRRDAGLQKNCGTEGGGACFSKQEGGGVSSVMPDEARVWTRRLAGCKGCRRVKLQALDDESTTDPSPNAFHCIKYSGTVSR